MSDNTKSLQKELDQARQQIGQLTEECRDLKRALREHVLKDLLLGEVPDNQRAASLLKQYDVEFSSNVFVVAILKVISVSDFCDRRGLPRNFQTAVYMGDLIRAACERHLADYGNSYITRIGEPLALIISMPADMPVLDGDSTRKLISRLNRTFINLVKDLNTNDSIACHAAVGLPVTGLFKLSTAYEMAYALMKDNVSTQPVINNYTFSSPERESLGKRRFSVEQQFYIRIANRDYPHAAELLGQLLRSLQDSPGSTLSLVRSSMQRYSGFLLHSMGIDPYAPNPGVRTDIVRQYLDLNDAADYDSLRAWADRLIYLLNDFSDEAPQRETDKADSAMRYIRANCDKPDLTVESVCDAIGVSRTWLSREFKQKISMTPLEYIHRQRLEKAKQLIMKGLSLEDVATQSGYYSRRSFTEVFKAYEGMTPSRFRETFNEK